MDNNKGFVNRLLTPLNKADIQPLYEKITGPDGPKETAASEEPLYVQAARKRAEALGIQWDQLLVEYSERLMKSTYPTPACLTVEEVQAYSDGSELTSGQTQHIASCEPCRVLLEAARPSAEDLAPLMEEVRLLAIRATTPRTTERALGQASSSAGQPHLSSASKMFG